MHFGGVFDDRHERFAVAGREGDAIDVLVDEVVNDADLLAEIELSGGAVPEDLRAHFIAGLDCAGVNGLPEDVRLAFGNYGDAELRGSVAGGAGEEQDEACQRGPEVRCSHEFSQIICDDAKWPQIARMHTDKKKHGKVQRSGGIRSGPIQHVGG